MRPSIITSSKPNEVWGIPWLTVRELTPEDVTFSEWHFPNEAECKEFIGCCVSSYCVMTVDPSVYEQDGAYSALIKETFFGKRAMIMVVEFTVDVKRVGVPKNKQYLKYNEALDQLRELVTKQGEEKKSLRLMALNENIARFVDAKHKEYIEHFVGSMSKISSYKCEEVIKEAKAEALVAEIKELEQKLKEKEEEFKARQLKVVIDTWTKDSEQIKEYPQEAVDALLVSLKEKGIKTSQRVIWDD